MSNKKNVQKKRKIKPETAAKIRLGFASLINNDACIKIGRTWKWYFPVIAAIFAVLIALVPSFTQNMQVKAGTNFFASPSYGYEVGLVHAGEFLNEKNIDFVVEEAKLNNTSSNWASSFKEGENTWLTVKNSGNDKTIFELFYNDTDTSSAAAAPVDDLTFATRVVENQNPYTGEKRGSDEDVYANSAMILGKENIYLLKVGSTGSNAAQATGQYDRSEGLNLRSLFSAYPDGKKFETLDVNKIEYANEVRDSWRIFVNDAAETAKNIQALTYLGIMAAVYVALVFVFGLVIFLMTRGKKNPLRIYTFWETQKMAYVAALCPALISLALGFVISSFALFMFIFIYGIRIMWMSMKSLRAPTY